MDSDLKLNVLVASAAVVPSLVHGNELQQLTLTTAEMGVAIELRFAGEPSVFHYDFPYAGYTDITSVAFFLFHELQDFVAESSFGWGQARPQCPGHQHARMLTKSGDGLWWACPSEPSHRTEPAFPQLIVP